MGTLLTCCVHVHVVLRVGWGTERGEKGRGERVGCLPGRLFGNIYIWEMLKMCDLVVINIGISYKKWFKVLCKDYIPVLFVKAKILEK